MISSVLITISVALITYNVIISSTTQIPSFPRTPRPSIISVDPVIRMPLDRSRTGKPRRFHTAVTASDSVYNTWQCRVMYYWFKKARAEAGPDGEMGGFTRILHSGRLDQFMEEIPTFVADPLPPGMDQVLKKNLIVEFGETFPNKIIVNGATWTTFRCKQIYMGEFTRIAFWN